MSTPLRKITLTKDLGEPFTAAHPICVFKKLYRKYKTVDEMLRNVDERKLAAVECMLEGRYHGVARAFSEAKGRLPPKAELERLRDELARRVGAAGR